VCRHGVIHALTTERTTQTNILCPLSLPPTQTNKTKQACAKTRVVTRCLEPSWDLDEVVLLPSITPHAPPEQYAALHVLITAMDMDLTSADDIIGFALLPLAPLLAASPSEPHPFDLPLRKNGLDKGRGRVKGKVRLEWPEEGQVFREDRSKKGDLPKMVQLMKACCVVS
jgi:hypothetical protein